MENNQVSKSKNKVKIIFGLGTVAVGILSLLGFNYYKKKKNENKNETDDQPDAGNDTKDIIHHSSDTGLPPAGTDNSFPLKQGSKGTKVRELQQGIMRLYGKAALPRFGADGQFGTELESALRSKGFQIPLPESDFEKITKEKTASPPKTLISFDPSTIAKGIYYSIVAKDFDSARTLLKTIKNTKDYSSVSAHFKNYRVNGVHQTLINGALNSFPNTSQRQVLNKIFDSMGLKYDGKKWSI
jgi:hypothetical protein